MNLPPEIATEIREKLERARKLNPSGLSRDGKAVNLHGSIGYDCYFSPDGDIFIEEYDIGSDEPPTIDRSRLAEIAALVLTSQYMPTLAALLPKDLKLLLRVKRVKVSVGYIKKCFAGSSTVKVFYVINVLGWVGLKNPDRRRTTAWSGLGMSAAF